MARTTPVTIPTDDGAVLAGTWHAAEGEADAVVLVAGATAVPHRFYGRWAADLADRGFEVLSFDYRGIGASRLAPGGEASMSIWGRSDVGAALAAAEARAAGRPVLFVGHSFGGQALGLVAGGERLAGGLTIAAGWGWWGYQPVWRRPALLAVWYGAFPLLLASVGRIPANVGLGDGLPGGVAEEWSRWCRSRDYLLAHVPDARDRYARVRAPVHVWSFDDDAYIPPPAVEELARVLPGAVSRCVASAPHGGVGHFGFFRTRSLWDEAAATLRALAPPVRSAARA